MERFGIVDIGSNTIVLLVYEIQDGKPVSIRHISEPAHLIDHVHDGIMDREGIEKAATVLRLYSRVMDEMEVRYRFADITEPCRIENQDELVAALEGNGIEIHPLSGYEEAYYDWCGMRLSWPDHEDGIAFDVGGGSTELICFHNDMCVEALSFPLGCVRLYHLPLDTPECRNALVKAQSDFPALKRTCREIIGIGGTMRAAGLVLHELYGSDLSVSVTQLKEMFDRVKNEDPAAVAAVKNNVKKSRQPLFLPGVHMILEIADIYEAETILISRTNIREGFLLHCLQKTPYNLY